MPTSRSRITAARVRTADRPGRSRPTEDRIFRTSNAVILLDGASQPDTSDLDGGWYAETLGRVLRHALTALPTGDLNTLLADAIEAVAVANRLVAGNGPSATVSIVRWTDQDIDVLVLGDSPVVAATRTDEIWHITDDRLKQVGRDERRVLTAANGFAAANPGRWRELVLAEQAARNKPGGYWIAEASPEAAAHAHHACWAREQMTAILLMSDGVAAGVNRYGIPPDWTMALKIAKTDPAQLVDLVHDTEASDPQGERWPRSKQHDDKALAIVEMHYPEA
ncbi:protein phosphatase 2C domain-containing protein [Actinoplanes awajinensis]|uniref:PPM-type phosphatase domain-containing protein n=1 Tax=Actinoplanes awajinensis subsp. mycoplanecinus TaxID=135947 RepID=A0A0X3V7P4_9ACTN|nr:protein phosphatase 2C domain-containing protein [Actinoplanes awajinensis]KUL39286.1 hypothetical protein ADL15_09980 [Actinoplanes awajinensis subsp. mycoplanecinus]